MASSSAVELTVNSSSNDGQQSASSHRNPFSLPNEKRQRSDSAVYLQTITTDDRILSPTGEVRNDEDEEQVLVAHYDNQRLKQEKLLLITNVFRLFLVLVLAPILYFTV